MRCPPPPTPEQTYAVDFFTRQLALKVIAFAGAGKTSTLSLMASQMPFRRGLYMAFNKAIASESAGKFPRSVSCSTAHSLAYRDVSKRDFHGDKLRNNPRSRDFKLTAIRDKIPFHESIMRSIVATTLRRFCQSDSRTVSEFHVPLVPGLAAEHQEFAYKWAPDAAIDVWDRMTDPNDDLPMGHDGYLKLWALGQPRLQCDFLMVDEAQDLNPVLIGVVRNQDAQLVAVGDSHQQIYEWRGARDALVILPGHEARLTRSFRFGDAIAAAANEVLAAMGERFPLHGHSAIRDAVNPTSDAEIDAVLCRSNAGVIDSAIGFLEVGRPVCMPGGTGELKSMVEDAEALQAGARARTAELMAFESWREVQDFAGTDEGASLKVFVNLVGRYGCRTLLRVLAQILDQPVPGCVTITTAHKGKGREWPVVLIHDDFLASVGQAAEIGLAERRLFYVAITRAQRELRVDPDMLEAYSEQLTPV